LKYQFQHHFADQAGQKQPAVAAVVLISLAFADARIDAQRPAPHRCIHDITDST
jgi:hypothetical protein